MWNAKENSVGLCGIEQDVWIFVFFNDSIPNHFIETIRGAQKPNIFRQCQGVCIKLIFYLKS